MREPRTATSVKHSSIEVSESGITLKPKDLFGSKQIRNKRIDTQLKNVKNLNKRVSLNVQQLGKDIVDNVLCYH